jgi:two-component system, OmpR family, phosphate regulon response regulator PhoB
MSRTSKVLLIEDSIEAGQLVQRSLDPRIQIDWARSARDAVKKLEQNHFDMILLDNHLPDGDGIQLCSILQAHENWSRIPVIMITARASTPDKILAFTVGCDDYITKPFAPLELKARVEARLRKRERLAEESDRIITSGLHIDKRTHEVHVEEDGVLRKISLTPREFKILLLLASRPGVILSRDQILDAAWGENVYVCARNVDTHVSKLRKKLGSKADMIESAHRSGYRFIVGRNEKPAINLSNVG